MILCQNATFSQLFIVQFPLEPSTFPWSPRNHIIDFQPNWNAPKISFMDIFLPSFTAIQRISEHIRNMDSLFVVMKGRAQEMNEVALKRQEGVYVPWSEWSKNGCESYGIFLTSICPSLIILFGLQLSVCNPFWESFCSEWICKQLDWNAQCIWLKVTGSPTSAEQIKLSVSLF